MPKDKTLKYRELRAILSHHGVYEVAHRGKGSHRLFVCDDVDGKKISYPVACHKEGQTVNSYIVKRIRETFKISFEDFYAQ